MSEYCFSRIRKWKTINGKRCELPRINHIPADGQTLCGIQYGPYWDFDYEDRDVITCLRCIRARKGTTV